MKGHKFPVSILIDFRHGEPPIHFIQDDVLKLLLSIRQNMIAPGEQIIVHTPNVYNLSLLGTMKEYQIQPSYTDDLSELFEKDSEIVSVYTDHPEYADQVSNLCDQNGTFCNRKVFLTHDFKNQSEDVREKVEKEPPQINPKYKVVKKDVAKIASTQKGALPERPILRKDGIIQDYHIQTNIKTKKRELEEHAVETERLKKVHKDSIDLYSQAKGTDKEKESETYMRSAYEEVQGRDETERTLRENVAKAVSQFGLLRDSSHIQTLMVEEQLPNDASKAVKNGHPYILLRTSSKQTLTVYDNVLDKQEGPMSTMALHKYWKSGGADEHVIEDLAKLAIDRHLKQYGGVPDQIITPPTTWVPTRTEVEEKKVGRGKNARVELVENVIPGDDKEWGSPEQKASTLIHVRVAQKMVGLLQGTIGFDKKTGVRIEMRDFRERLAHAKSHEVDDVYDSVDFRSPKYDPMFLGTKDFEVKKIGRRDLGLDVVPITQTAQEVRENKQPTSRRQKVVAAYQGVLEDFYTDPEKEGVLRGKSVLILDDNVDSGVTFDVLKHNLGYEGTPKDTKVATLALFNMGDRPPKAEKIGGFENTVGVHPDEFETKDKLDNYARRGKEDFFRRNIENEGGKRKLHESVTHLPVRSHAPLIVTREISEFIMPKKEGVRIIKNSSAPLVSNPPKKENKL